MMNTYLWQDKTFPHWTWDTNSLLNPLGEVHTLQGLLLGRMAVLGFDGLSQQVEAITSEIVGSSQIEGVALNADSVRSSVARHLGLDTANNERSDHYTEGVVNSLLDATKHHDAPLTAERMFGWHAAYFPTGYSDGYKITVAGWRVGEAPMQVVSGPMGREKVHFEAPPSDKVPDMMAQFIDWCNRNDDTDPIVRAAVAHLWFVTIHPFDDGNGRMARTITEMMLARADGTDQRFYSLSAEMMRQRKNYYEVLESAQKGTTDITPWLLWFVEALRNALVLALNTTDRVLRKAAFWNEHKDTEVNERQRKIINHLWDGFDGKLTTQKYAKINHCSQDTALRDIQDLIEKNVLSKTAEGGRSSSYELINQR
ncbi:MAG: Fic family protein [Paludibacteraceae bacterium]|nr:Fic family protein [Paludibacteraceae bacterium]